MEFSISKFPNIVFGKAALSPPYLVDESNTGITTTVSMEQGSEYKRCERCRVNSAAIINLRRSRTHETVIIQATFAALASSALKGCDLCKLLRQGLIYSTACPAEYEALQRSKQSVVLWYSPANTFHKGMFPPSTRDNFVVSCSVYPKWYMSLIPFHFGPEHGGEELASSSNDLGQRSGKRRSQAEEYLLALAHCND